jgi:serine/threonine-protein kinase PpkA
LALTPVCQAAPAADERKPLTMPDKKSLYQRILTRPGALLYAIPSEKEVSRAKPLPPLSVFFVYARGQIEGKEWLEVGAASRGPADGWLPGDKAIDWKQTLTVALTNPVGREPTLFFRNRDGLMRITQSQEAGSEITQLRDKIKRDAIQADFPIIAMEPSTSVDLWKNFYILPILGFDEAYLEGGKYFTRLLNVAAVTLRRGDQDLRGKGRVGVPLSTTNPSLKKYRVGIVFVIDTTISMGPYLDRTREAVGRIYQRLKASRWGKNVSFGLVAFRNNIEVRPGLEYVTRAFATLADGRDETTFFQKVNQAVPAKVSSHQFNEDAYAGVFKAIKEYDWSDYDGRFIILITDAGALEANDRFSQTHLSADGLRILAQEKGTKIAIYTLHLLTPEGRDNHNHETAASQYHKLTAWPDAGSLYFGVEIGKSGSVIEFGKQIDALTDSLIQQVADASAGKLVEVPAAGTASDWERQTAIVGRAMQLDYLGRVGETEVPPLINAWVAELDLERPPRHTLEVRILITKNQLSDLQQTLRAILQAGEETLGKGSKDFFAQVRSAAARLARDPENVNVNQVRSLADSVGQVNEWLEGLPYKSKIMNITEDDWLGWSYTQQEDFLNRIEEKIIWYQEFHDAPNRWHKLDLSADMSDAVCSIPLDALP